MSGVIAPDWIGPDWIDWALVAMLFAGPGYLWWAGTLATFRRRTVKLLQGPIVVLVLAAMARAGCVPAALCVAPARVDVGQGMSGLWSALEMPDPGWLRPLAILGWVVLFAFVMPAVFGYMHDRRQRRRANHRDAGRT